MAKGLTHNLRVPLPAKLFKDLAVEARRRRRPATALARTAIEQWLRRLRRIELCEAIAAYAAEQVGTTADLDEAWEEAGLEFWRNSERNLIC